MLLRTGAFLAFLAVLATAALGLFGASVMSLSSERPGMGTLTLGVALVGVVWSCPIGLFIAGYSMRQREKRIVAIWDLLKRSGEIRVKPLLADSEFTTADFDRAVKLLNTRGLGHYVWDRRSNTIRDARLHDSIIHFEVCDACNAEISIEVSVATHEIPRCPYCFDPVSVLGMDERRQKVLQEVRSEGKPVREPVPENVPLARPARKSESGFSVLVFLLLLVAFWPAGLAYAYFKWEGGS